MNGTVGFLFLKFVFVAVTEYVIVSEKKENRARKRRESRAEERERVICGNSKFNGV